MTTIPLPPPTQDFVDAKRDITVPWYNVFKRLASSSVRTALTEDTTFYVDPTGSDTSGNGTLPNPFATPQAAYEYLLANIDANGFFIKIKMAAGTYTASSQRRPTDEFSNGTNVVTLHSLIPGCPCVEFEGQIAAGPDYSGNPTIWDAAGGGIAYIAAADGLWRFESIAFKDSAGTSDRAIFANAACTFSLSHVDFAAFQQYHLHIGPNTIIKIFGSYSISGNCTAHIWMEGGSKGDFEGITVTMVGAPVLDVFYLCDGGSNIVILDTTYSGASTGQRYKLKQGSTISTDFTGPLDSYIPGSTPGDYWQECKAQYFVGVAYANRPTNTTTGNSIAVASYITDATTNAWGVAVVGGSTYKVLALNQAGSTVWKVAGI